MLVAVNDRAAVKPTDRMHITRVRMACMTVGEL
jgi:hypothetical protein